MKLVSLPSRCMAVAAFCTLVFSPVSTRADVQTIRNSDTAYWASVGAAQVNYKESVSPIPNSQHGWIPSMAAGLDYMGNSGWYFATEGSLSLGDDYYNGAYLAAPTVPVGGTTHALIAAVDGKIGKGFVLGNSAVFTPYLDLGYRYWERDLGNDQIEKYDNFEALGGAMLQYSPSTSWVMSAYGAAGLTFSGQMSTGGTDFDLGSAGVYKLGGKVGYNLTQRLELFTSGLSKAMLSAGTMNRPALRAIPPHA